MELQERVGDGTQDGAAVQVEAAEADDAGGDAPVLVSSPRKKEQSSDVMPLMPPSRSTEMIG